MNKVCPACEGKNDFEARYCVFCGADFSRFTGNVVVLCDALRHTLDPTWKTCPYCRMEEEEAAADLEESNELTTPFTPGAGAEAPWTPPPLPPPQVRGLSPDTAPGGREAESTPFSPGLTGEEDLAAEDLVARRIAGALTTFTWRPEGQLFTLFQGRNTIGRRAECEIRIPRDPMMSGRHAVIEWDGSRFFLEDAGSLNGTAHNDQPVNEPVFLGNYDRIRTGVTEWVFVLLERPEPL